MAAPEPPPPPEIVVVGPASGRTNVQESTRLAFWSDFDSRVAISVSPEKFPQNICAVLVLKYAAFNPVKDEAGAPGKRSGLPSAFATFSQLPKQDDG